MIFSILLLIVTVIEQIPGASLNEASVPKGKKTSMQWGMCEDTHLNGASAQCGSLSVPLDYSRPNGAKIRLAIARIQHKVSKSEFQGILLFSVDGPGGVGKQQLIKDTYLPATVLDMYDLIAFDQRGAGSSQPSISCDPEYFSNIPPNYLPDTDKTEQVWLRRSKNYAKACAQNNSTLLSHMTTANTAKDVENIRIALSQNKINFYATSDGTYLGQIYATLYPTRIRCMVLDANVDPRTIGFQASIRQDLGLNRNLKAWFRWMAKYDDYFSLGKTECEVEDKWNTVLKSLIENPINGTFGQTEWLHFYTIATYAVPWWITLGYTFSYWFNFAEYHALLYSYANLIGSANENRYASYLATICTDSQ